MALDLGGAKTRMPHVVRPPRERYPVPLLSEALKWRRNTLRPAAVLQDALVASEKQKCSHGSAENRMDARYKYFREREIMQREMKTEEHSYYAHCAHYMQRVDDE